MNEPGDRNYPRYSRESIDEANDRQRAAKLVVPTSGEDQNTAIGAWFAFKRFFGHQQVKDVRDSLTVLPGGLTKQENPSAVTPVIHTVDRHPNHPSRGPILH
jgi:hypothetical protein